ncbi:MAG: aldo/keto reductase, partial [Nostoc sp.]
MTQVQVVLDELRWWKDSGVVRYVGVTTHNRAIALEMIERHQCDVLMHRYNMAHRQAEQNVLPAAQKAGIPVVAFTCTDINLPPAMDYHYYYSRLGKLP